MANVVHYTIHGSYGFIHVNCHISKWRKWHLIQLLFQTLVQKISPIINIQLLTTCLKTALEIRAWDLMNVTLRCRTPSMKPEVFLISASDSLDLYTETGTIFRWIASGSPDNHMFLFHLSIPPHVFITYEIHLNARFMCVAKRLESCQCSWYLSW